MSCNQVFESIQITFWVDIDVPGGGDGLPKKVELLCRHYARMVVDLISSTQELKLIYRLCNGHQDTSRPFHSSGSRFLGLWVGVDISDWLCLPRICPPEQDISERPCFLGDLQHTSRISNRQDTIYIIYLRGYVGT